MRRHVHDRAAGGEVRSGDETKPRAELDVRATVTPDMGDRSPSVLQPIELRPRRRRVPWLTLAALVAACLSGGCLVALLGRLIPSRGDTCTRARACCEDYADILFRPEVPYRCENANLTDEQPEEWCRTMINDYRATLLRNGRPVPSTCQPPPRSWIESLRSSEQ